MGKSGQCLAFGQYSGMRDGHASTTQTKTTSTGTDFHCITLFRLPWSQALTHCNYVITATCPPIIRNQRLKCIHIYQLFPEHFPYRSHHAPLLAATSTISTTICFILIHHDYHSTSATSIATLTGA